MGMAKVNIISTKMIKPAEKTWATTTGTRMKLSEMDMAGARGFVPMLYLYKNPNRTSTTLISQTLLESLSKALAHFYPFAGRLRPLGGGRVDLEIDDEAVTWGVPFVEAETEAELGEDLLAEEEMGRLEDFFPEVDFLGRPLEELPLLAVKATHFRCGGVGLGICWSHAVTDGVGASHFYSEWTRLARGEPLEKSPVHDRTLMRAGEPPRSIPQHNVEHEAAWATPPPPPPPESLPPFTRILKLSVSENQINKLKQLAADITDARPYSRYEVLIAHAWRCASKARGHEGKRLNVLAVAVDFCSRVNPRLPQAYNDNAVIIMTATSDSEDLNSNPLGYACSRIRQTIEKVTDDFVWEHLDYLKSLEDLWEWRGFRTPEGLFVNPDISMPSWMKLSFNNLDFGWGNEIHMASSPPPWEGNARVRDGIEQGSAIVVMCLQVAHVDKFKDYFFHELN